MTRPETRPCLRVLVGPAICQGCRELVLYVQHGKAEGWMHANGNLRCWKQWADAA